MADHPVVMHPFPELVDVPEGFDNVVWRESTPLPPDSILERVTFYVPPIDHDKSSAPVMQRMSSLRVVQAVSTGYDHLVPDLPDGVTLCNGRGLNSAGTAEMAMTIALDAQRGGPQWARDQIRHVWPPERDFSTLIGKNALIVGHGTIGAEIDARLSGFGCNEVKRVARRARDGVEPVTNLPELLPNADVVFLSVDLNDDTQHLVDESFLRSMRDDALLVNVSRGSVVDTDALMAELNSGRLRAALDVTDPEPLPADHPLWDAPGVLITPHLAGSIPGFFTAARELASAQVERFAAGEPLVNVMIPGATEAGGDRGRAAVEATGDARITAVTGSHRRGTGSGTHITREHILEHLHQIGVALDNAGGEADKFHDSYASTGRDQAVRDEHGSWEAVQILQPSAVAMEIIRKRASIGRDHAASLSQAPNGGEVHVRIDAVRKIANLIENDTAFIEDIVKQIDDLITDSRMPPPESFESLRRQIRAVKGLLEGLPPLLDGFGDTADHAMVGGSA